MYIEYIFLSWEKISTSGAFVQRIEATHFEKLSKFKFIQDFDSNR